MSSKDEQGFSLVEISVVLAIIGIIAMISFPAFFKIMPRIRLSNGATTLATTLANIRMQAIAQSREFQVIFDTAADRYHLEKRNGGAWVRYSTVTTTGVDLDDVGGFGTIGFLASGTSSVPLGGQAIIHLQTCEAGDADDDGQCDQPGSHQRQILVEATGRVMVQKRMYPGSWASE